MEQIIVEKVAKDLSVSVKQVEATLKMLEEGKITTEESIKLIKACDQSSSIDDIADNVKKFVEATKVKLEPYYDDAVEEAKKLYKKAEPTIKEVGENAKKVYKKAEPKVKETIGKVKKSVSKKK